MYIYFEIEFNYWYFLAMENIESGLPTDLIKHLLGYTLEFEFEFKFWYFLAKEYVENWFTY